MKNMKYRSYHLLLAGIFSLLTTGAMAEKTSDKPYWQDVQVVSVNKEYPRTSFMTSITGLMHLPEV